MRFRQSGDNELPSINLIPMMDILMTVLIFFVMLSASLSSEQIIQVNLPPEQAKDTPLAPDDAKEPFIVEMDATGQQQLNGVPIATDQLTAEVQAYLARNADSIVYLLPSRELPYEQVVQFLGDMRAVGGDRVSLALEDTPPAASPPAAN